MSPTPSRAIRVRVVPTTSWRWLGWLVGLTNGGALIAIASYAWRPLEDFHVSKFWAFGIALAGWSLGTLLQWRPRPYVTNAVATDTELTLGTKTIAASRISGVEVAPARRGHSIAIAMDRGDGLFLEVEREDDARDLAEKLTPWPGSKECVMSQR